MIEKLNYKLHGISDVFSVDTISAIQEISERVDELIEQSNRQEEAILKIAQESEKGGWIVEDHIVSILKVNLKTDE